MRLNNAAIIVSLCFFVACSKAKNTDMPDVPPVMPEQALEKFTVSETRKGMPNWVLNAASAQIMEKEKRVLMQKPVIMFYKDGAYSSTLKARSGRINTENYDIWADGVCELATTQGETLTTTNLVYASATGKITTNDFVRIVRPDEVIEGIGMEATPSLDDITIKKQKVIMRDEIKSLK